MKDDVIFYLQAFFTSELWLGSSDACIFLLFAHNVYQFSWGVYLTVFPGKADSLMSFPDLYREYINSC